MRFMSWTVVIVSRISDARVTVAGDDKGNIPNVYIFPSLPT